VALVRVLVVDDEPVSGLVAATIVRRLGDEVTTASDGDDAWLCVPRTASAASAAVF